jgi:hypothetical protein
MVATSFDREIEHALAGGRCRASSGLERGEIVLGAAVRSLGRVAQSSRSDVHHGPLAMR